MKNTLDRAIKYLRFKKMKSFLLVLLFMIVSSMLLLSATLNSTISNYYEQLDTTNGISVSVTPKMNFNKRQSSSNEDTTQIKPSDIRSKFVNLSDEQLEEIKKLGYVSDVMQSTSLNVTSSSIEEISYSSSTSDNSSSSGMNDMPQRENISGLRITGSSHLNLENDFTNETISLSSGNLPVKDNEIMVSETLASSNTLKIGSSFKVVNANSTSKTKTYKVVGIYSYNNELNEMALQTVPENIMYTSYSSLSSLIDSNSNNRVTTQFFIYDVDDLEQFKDDYFKIIETSSSDYEVSLNDSVYKNTIEPLSQLASIVDIAKVVVLVIVSIILAIISYLMIKERNYEIGVLYSISESKKNIVMQFIMENGILLTIGYVIALLINKLIGNSIISSLMNMDLLNGVKDGARQMGGGPMNSFSPEMASSDIEAYLNVFGMVQVYLVILIVVLIITIATLAKTLAKRPKEIISS
ncbi:putative ABC transport system permease protein [Bacilli bacterium PM5-9]|nr:putative ABC transport system permease protein [Bacilli bacterium PM5-9]